MADLKEARVPDIGDYDGVPVIELLVAVGDTVSQDQGLVTLESDKATMEVPAPFAGVIRELKVKVGDELAEGSVVAMIEPVDATDAGQGEQAKPEQAQPDAKADKAPEEGKAGAPSGGAAKSPASEAPAPPPDRASERNGDDAGTPAPPAPPSSPPVAFNADELLPDKVPYASPAVRLLARELGVDLGRVKGSGRGGRIVKEDVQQFVKSVMQGGGLPGTTPSVAAGGAGLNLLPWPKVDFS
jgi:pyruvate dehydrogenase E2 component (dihydrolipoamide acetyltransferase)